MNHIRLYGARPIERFMLHVRIDAENRNSCWEWMAAISSQGLPMFARSTLGGGDSARRFAWEHFHRVCLPREVHVRALCGDPRCVNPLHADTFGGETPGKKVGEDYRGPVLVCCEMTDMERAV